MELELLKEIPGYKAILKSVIKTQIQLLIEQLSNHTGEESIILTASLNEGTLSHLGSTMGKGFFEGRDEIKSQFLCYCLKNQQKRNIPEPRTPFQEEVPPDRFQSGPAPKRQKVLPVSLVRTDQDYANPNFSMPVPVQQDSFVPSPEVSQPFIQGPPPRPPAPKVRRPSSARSSPSFQNNPANGSMLKNEPSNDNQDSVSSFSNSEDSSSVPAFQPPNIPPTVHLTHTQTGTPFNISSDNGTEFTNTEPSETAQAGDSNNDSTIKLEPVGEGELDLEITGVELGSGAEGFQGDWGQDTSGGQDMSGFPQSESGDSSLNQSGSQYNIQVKNNICTKYVRDINGLEVAFFKCRTCEKTFTTKQSVQRHHMIHTGQKDFVCEKCNKTFNRKDALKQHMRSHGMVEGFHYRCRVCLMGLKSRASVRSHMMSSHPEAI